MWAKCLRLITMAKRHLNSIPKEALGVSCPIFWFCCATCRGWLNWLCFFLFFICFYFSIYLGSAGSSLRHMDLLVVACGLLVVAWGLLSCSMQTLSCGMWTLSCGMHAASSSPTRDWTRAPCIGSTESYPLDHQGSPGFVFIKKSYCPVFIRCRLVFNWCLRIYGEQK